MKRAPLISDEFNNPITRSDKVYFKDENGDYEYKNNKYKSIDDLLIENVIKISLYSFSKYHFNKISIYNTHIIDACTFYLSTVNIMDIDEDIEIIGFNALPQNLKIVDGYFDLANNKKLILAKLDNVKNQL